jgi:hypothetical protein
MHTLKQTMRWKSSMTTVDNSDALILNLHSVTVQVEIKQTKMRENGQPSDKNGLHINIRSFITIIIIITIIFCTASV